MGKRYGSIDEYESMVFLHPAIVDEPSSSDNTTTVSDEPTSLKETTPIRSSPALEGPPRLRMDDIFLKALGFESNPLRMRTDIPMRNGTAADLRLSMLSNFSTAYNVLSISLSLKILEQLYPATARDKGICSSALIAGMIAGQLFGGTLGDVLGRHRAMSIVMMLQVLAALLSACCMDTAYVSIYGMLAFWRFFLGVGCGGVYPLSASLTAESTDSGKDRAKLVAFAFSFQGIGYFAVPLFSLIVVSISPNASEVTWRLILAVGALPGIVLTIIRASQAPFRRRRSSGCHYDAKCAVKKEPFDRLGRVVPVSVWDAITKENDLTRKMLGTGGCWLLFDIMFYGNTLFQPVVMSHAFGAAETVQKSARDSSILTAMALPGYFVSVFAVGRISPRTLQLQGFFFIGLLYAIIGFQFNTLSGHEIWLMSIYGMTFFFSNFGPNASTFMLPSMTYSKACRSTLNGICAAFGKVGALIGTAVFVWASDHFGNQAVFLACAILALIGCMLTWFCVSKDIGHVYEAETTFDGLSLAERYAEEGRLSQVPLKLIYSEPSLFDHFHDALIDAKLNINQVDPALPRHH